MSTNQVERFIAELAQEAFQTTGYSFSTVDEVRDVLERRLKPLLEAGQEARDSIGNYAMALSRQQGIGQAIDRCTAAVKAWDAAIEVDCGSK